ARPLRRGAAGAEDVVRSRPRRRRRPHDLRSALVTGANRRRGIGCAIARRLEAGGARVFTHGFGDGDADVDVTADLADPEAPARADRGIRVNAVNPGPTNTGYLDGVEPTRMPAGRWGEPDDAARLIAWLCSDDGRWVTGQVIDSEGGFRR